MALTAKMKAFAQAIVDGMSKKDAAISAGYPEKSAMQQGSKLSKNPEIIAYIDQYSTAKKLTSEKKKLTPENPAPKPVASGEDDNPFEDNYAKDDPLQFLIDVMNNKDNEIGLLLHAAKSVLPYVHGKVAEKGKKESKADGAKQTATGGGKFGTLDSQLRS